MRAIGSGLPRSLPDSFVCRIPGPCSGLLILGVFRSANARARAAARLAAVARAVSSVGRASRLHREGRRFEPVTAHQAGHGNGSSPSVRFCPMWFRQHAFGGTIEKVKFTFHQHRLGLGLAVSQFPSEFYWPCFSLRLRRTSWAMGRCHA